MAFDGEFLDVIGFHPGSMAMGQGWLLDQNENCKFQTKARQQPWDKKNTAGPGRGGWGSGRGFLVMVSSLSRRIHGENPSFRLARER